MLTTLNFMSPSGNVTLPPLTIFWVASWMSQNFFKLNENKTEIIAFCPKHSSNLIQSQLGPLSLNQTTKNLGVMFDAELCFDAQVRIRVSTVKSPKLDLFYLILTYTRFYMLSSSLVWTIAMDFILESVRAPSTNSKWCRTLLPEFNRNQKISPHNSAKVTHTIKETYCA